MDKVPKNPPPVKRKRATKFQRKKEPKALSREDGLRALLIAAILICLAGLVFTARTILEPPAAGPGDSSPIQDVPADSGQKPAEELLFETPAMTVLPPVSAAPVRQTSAPPARLPPKPAPKQRGTLVFVIDDAGNNLRELEPFLRFPGPLTIAVLPGLPNSAEAARRIRAAGKEVLLHQPMEALGGQNPGPGAIYSGMSAGDIRAIVARNIAEIGPIVGMNNHQGSKVSMDEQAMETVLAICREYGIYFLDSRTTADTAAPKIAHRMGMKIGERDVFIDNIQERAAMIRSVHEGLRKAENKGAAVMIGHTWSSELAFTLGELYPELVEQGYSLSTISRFMMGIGNEGFGD